ncbi:MAG TPA: hypothetical protein ENL09_00915 [Bacteroidetes bacterium]|nr:hypothetical protein [Bacteroidota bacterium]
MKRIVIVFILIISANQFAFAQNNKDVIEVEQSFGGNKYTIGGKSLSIKQMKTLMINDESAYTQLKSGRAYSTAATILGATGGFMIGLNLGAALVNNSDANNETKWGLAIAGGVLVLVSIPLTIAGKKRTLKAVDIYNTNLTLESFHQTKPEFRIGFTGSGIGLIIKL